MTIKRSRRRFLKGILGGAAVTVGLPLFDALFDDRGLALAQTGAIPRRFGTWFWGCGINPSRWVPTTDGAGYDTPPELAMAVAGYQDRILVLTGFDTPLNGRNNYPHYSPAMVTLTGDSPTGGEHIPGTTFDVEIANVIGTTTRFRTLDITADGQAAAWSALGAGALAPAISTPLGLYQRVFAQGFQHGNGEFVPDPAVMVRKSVLSTVLEESKRLEATLGSADRQRLDQYYTSVRQLENQLEILLAEPPDLPGCKKLVKPKDVSPTLEIDALVKNHNLLADLLAVPLTSDQTRVFNVNLWRLFTEVRFDGEDIGYHQLTHDEGVDSALGYQPLSQRFFVRAMDCWQHLLGALDAIEEGDGTLLDHVAIFAHSGPEFPKEHGTTNIPMMVAGGAGGTFAPGRHIRGAGSPTSRVASHFSKHSACR
ncbi:MAG: hypothetical protein ACI9OJ_003875 [Myxococcota bacterium]|jgi:hypothetical protein